MTLVLLSAEQAGMLWPSGMGFLPSVRLCFLGGLCRGLWPPQRGPGSALLSRFWSLRSGLDRLGSGLLENASALLDKGSALLDKGSALLDTAPSQHSLMG